MGLKSRIVPFYVLELIVTALLFLWLTDLSKGVSVEKGISFFTLGVLAYTFGLRHAFDADHLAAIDNTTRKLVQEGKGASFTGLFFSLGHSSVVVLLSLSLIIAARTIASNVPALESLGSIVGTLVSGLFLYVIGLLNFFVLLEIYKIFKKIKEEKIDERKLNETLLKRGFMSRYFRNLFKIVKSQYYLYPIGFLFGLGFDTASETALLAISAASATEFSFPTWELLIFSFLFTAGMTLIDTTDGLFMNTAYRWAFLGAPLRKVWYNLTMTSISVLVAYVIGTLELLGMVQSELGLKGPFWGLIEVINQDAWWGNIGMIIIATFTLTWATSMIVYKVKYKRYE
ncbi:HoxN/HupN/NixA family nickel/cobalt transporter [Metallosphaera cuprina]|uniref:Nickel/cobalt efflux system n=1 Tax=Metallosphaera cuprina (strain Ar-4) TaxID=1006006 RepID=F4G2Y2_METCR|nr:HoxN/HupN/NixA family nickel/cobalt transporter [Metallosphaera cuprina]AEB95180.1 high-affinity nickel-transporter [Metallosphaera cuprina Ar-4]